MSTEWTRNYDWTDDKDAGTPITASRMDSEFDDIATKLNQKCVIKSSAPSSPIAGMLWLDSTNKLLKQYRNSEWVVMGAVHVGTSAPTTKQEGDLWYDSTNNILKIYTSTTASIIAVTSGSFGTLGQMLYSSGGSATAPISLGMGTINQFLCSNGIGSAPSFKALGTAVGTAYVITTDLKTTTGEVSTSANASLALPGGEYGFYPQIRATDTSGPDVSIGLTGYAITTSYSTRVAVTPNSNTTYVQQRYVTASGLDRWLFLLIDKITNETISAYFAPDHPAYGNGGNFDAIPHPFGNYDKDKHFIILIDQKTIEELEKDVTYERSLLTILTEEYGVKIDEELVYEPLHSGKMINKEGKLVKQMVDAIPDYIKVRKLKKVK